MVIDRRGHGSTSNIIYVFKNTVPVEATTSYNETTGEIDFYEPGTPVKEMILEP